MSKIPSKWATVDAAWGEGRKHLYSPDEKSLKWHSSETAARAYAAEQIQEGRAMVGVFEVKTLLVPKAIEFDEIA